MTKQQQFFYDNAGGSWNPSTETQEEGTRRYAAELAAAETYAREQGWTFTWEADDIPCQHQDGEDHEAEACDLDDGTRLLASLSGICGATPEYRRVVQAELALEAMHAHMAATPPAEPQEAATALKPTHVLDWDHRWSNGVTGEIRLFLAKDDGGQWQLIDALEFDGKGNLQPLRRDGFDDVRESFEDNRDTGYDFDAEAAVILPVTAKPQEAAVAPVTAFTWEKLGRALAAVSDALSEVPDADWKYVVDIQNSINLALETVDKLEAK